MQEQLSLKEIKGQDEAIAKLLDFVKDYSKQRKKAALLYGPSGTGKTASAYAVASCLGCEIMETNASDFRSKERINTLIGETIKQKSLFSKGKIILVDEADMVSGTKDRGCLSALINLFDITTFPILLTANDAWHQKLDGIRTKTELIKFNSLNYEIISKILSEKCKKEKIEVDDTILKEIAINAKGDARAAINDLGALTNWKTAGKIVNKKAMAADMGKRNKEISILEALKRIFKEEPAKDIFDNVSLDLNDCFLWIDENLPLEYNNEELAQAYEALSKADIFRKRIIRQQHWHFLAYVSTLISAGISSAKQKPNAKFISYKRPSRILKIWIAKQKNAKKKAIAEKLAKATHCSARKAMQEMPLIQLSCRNNKTLLGFAQELGLGEEEISYLKNT